jgi:hypothetical protein
MSLALRKHVERVVRPLPAGKVKKLAIRRELLSHLAALFDEEMARLHDEPQALAAAQSRFGDPAGLAAELAHSLSARDRLAWRVERGGAWLNRLLFPVAGDSPLRYAARCGVAVLAGHAALAVAGLLLLLVVPGSPHDPTRVPTALKFLLHGPVGTWGYLMSIACVYHLAFERRGTWRWLATGAAMLAFSLFFAVHGWAFWLHLVGDLALSLERAPRLIASSLVVGPVLISLAVAAARHAERKQQAYRDWTGLVLDE